MIHLVANENFYILKANCRHPLQVKHNDSLVIPLSREECSDVFEVSLPGPMAARRMLLPEGRLDQLVGRPPEGDMKT